MGIQNTAETKDEEKPPHTVKESFIKNTAQQGSVSSAKRTKRYKDNVQKNVSLKIHFDLVPCNSLLLPFFHL